MRPRTCRRVAPLTYFERETIMPMCSPRKEQTQTSHPVEWREPFWPSPPWPTRGALGGRGSRGAARLRLGRHGGRADAKDKGEAQAGRGAGGTRDRSALRRASSARYLTVLADCPCPQSRRQGTGQAHRLLRQVWGGVLGEGRRVVQKAAHSTQVGALHSFANLDPACFRTDATQAGQSKLFADLLWPRLRRWWCSSNRARQDWGEKYVGPQPRRSSVRSHMLTWDRVEPPSPITQAKGARSKYDEELLPWAGCNPPCLQPAGSTTSWWLLSRERRSAPSRLTTRCLPGAFAATPRCLGPSTKELQCVLWYAMVTHLVRTRPSRQTSGTPSWR